MLNIIYGTEESKRDKIAYERIADIIRSDDVCYLLVPEQFSLSTEKFIIKKFGISAQTKVKVITFSRLCNLILSKLGPLRMKYIDGAGKQIIAAETIRIINGKLGVLASSLKRRGFSATIVELVSEFKRYGVSAEQIEVVLQDNSETELSKKLADISLIFKTFNALLGEQAADAEDNLEVVSSKIKECDFFKGTLFVMQFRSFTPIEYEVLGEMMQHMEVYAVMCCDDVYNSSPLFAPVANTCIKLIETAEKKGILFNKPIPAERDEKNKELSYLAKSYFEANPKPYPKTPENIKVFEVSNIYREIETAADLILQLCRKEGRKFSDFLILARNTESYNRIIPEVFGSRGIDVFLDTRRSILTKPLCQMMCAAFDILSYGYSYERVMNIARTGIIDIADDDIDMFENYLLAVNPSHAMWSDEKWSYCPKGYDIEVINQTRNILLGFVKRIEGSLSGRKTAGEICAAVLDALAEEKMAEHTEEMCSRFEMQGMPYLANEYKQVWNSVNSVLSQISVLMDKDDITWKDFGELFRNACGGISVGLTPQTQGGVVFSAIDRFRTDGKPVVIVVGMTDGVFPASHTAEGLLSDAERTELLRIGIQLASGADAKRREEQLLIYSVLTAAKEKLYLFTPIADADGRRLEPSPIIKKIQKQIFPNIPLFNPDKDEDFMKFSEGRAAAFEILCSRLAEKGGNPELLQGGEKLLFEYFENIPEFSKSLKDILGNMIETDKEKLSKEAVEAIYGKTVMLSASKLEKYNACAFSYFMNYGLCAAEREKAGIEPRSTGSIQHEALYKYFSELQKSEKDYADITIDDCYDRVYSIVKDEAVQSGELLYESSSYYKYIVTRMQGIAARTAWEVVKFYKSSRFRPMGFEITIDTNGDIPAIDIKDNDGKKIARLRGKIDRADTAVINGKTYVSVIDYKSSQKNLDERLAAAGVTLQPLLYSDIVCSRLSASPAAMLYMQMTDPIVDESKLREISFSEIERITNKNIYLGGWISDKPEVIEGYGKGAENGETYIPSGKSALVGEDELKRRIDAANQKIRETAMEICDGNIDAKPYVDKGFDACQYCAYKSSCRQ